MDLKFWKKDDADFDLDNFPDTPDLSSDFSAPSQDQQLSTPSSEPQFSAPMQPQQAPSQSSDDVHTQLILARLDAITNKLDVLSSRVENIESFIKQPQQQQNSQSRGPWYGQQ